MNFALILKGKYSKGLCSLLDFISPHRLATWDSNFFLHFDVHGSTCLQ